MQSRRIPHLGHVLLFLLLTFVSLLLAQTLTLAATGSLHSTNKILETIQNEKLQLATSALTYLIALIACAAVFPTLWRRAFLSGLHWNVLAARPKLALFGLLLGFGSQAVSTLLPIPRHLPIDTLFHTRELAWFLVFFGTIFAPLFEEILFRGFLLPAIAVTIDWLRLPRSFEALTAWQHSETFSRPALVTSSILTSLLFALIHAPQLGYTVAALALLAVISLILCVIRIRTNSVAASTLVHSCYNLSVFLTLFASTSGFRHLDRI